MVINHIDGNKTNNRIKNLEAVTRSENCIHRFKNDLNVKKLTCNDVREIKYLLKIGYPTKFISRRYNINNRHVYNIIKETSWDYV